MSKVSILTADGSHALNNGNISGRSVVYVSGDFGGATATLGYNDGSDTEVALSDGALASGEQYTIHHGAGQLLRVLVAGATGSTAIRIKVASIA